MKRSFRWAGIVIGAALFGALITLAILHPAAKESDDEDGGTPLPSRVTTIGGQTVVSVDAPEQQRIGMRTVPLAATRQAPEVQAFGNVVDVQQLAAIEKELATARADAEQARARAAYDRAELSRLRTLYANAQIVSQRDVQSAAATVAIDQAAVDSANAAINAASGDAVQRFGPVLAAAIASQSPLERDLVSARRMLVEITLPPDAAAPQTIRLTAADGSEVPATLLSAAPRVDPRLQGASYFYVAPAGKLASGMNVTARLTDMPPVDGVVVPSDAMVMFDNRSWVYVKRDSSHFSRHEISIANPVAGGFFITDLSPGTEVVTTGAQQLLSEEMRARLHAD